RNKNHQLPYPWNKHDVQIIGKYNVPRDPGEYYQGYHDNCRSACRKSIYPIGKIGTVGYRRYNYDNNGNKDQPSIVFGLRPHPRDKAGVVQFVILKKRYGCFYGFYFRTQLFLYLKILCNTRLRPFLHGYLGVKIQGTAHNKPQDHLPQYFKFTL